MTTKEIKKRYFEKTFQDAKTVLCACGCGKQLKEKDHYGRFVQFINGHNGRKYDNPTEYKRVWNHKHRMQRQIYKMVYYRRRKVELIRYKGSKCTKCSIEYNGENGALFQFHHRNPSEKKFQLGNQITNRAWKEILLEADKCDLICANCHSLLESTVF